MKMGLLFVVVIAVLALDVSVSLAQPVIAGCAPCAAAKAAQAAKATAAEASRAMLAAADPILARAPNITARPVAAITKAIKNIVGSRAAGDVVEKIGPVVERFKNMTIYRLNNTPKISIAKGMKLKVRPVTSETEHIKINGTSLIVHNVTNPALQISMIIRKENGTVEKNMTITRIKERDNNKTRLNITVKNATALTDGEVIYENGTIYIKKLNKTIELKTLPDMARERVREHFSQKEAGAEIRGMSIDVIKDKLKYVVKTRTIKRILGFLPINVEEETELNADTGEVGPVRGPWWGFLAW